MLIPNLFFYLYQQTTIYFLKVLASVYCDTDKENTISWVKNGICCKSGIKSMKPDIKIYGDVVQHKRIGTVIHHVLDTLKYKVQNKSGLPYTLVLGSSFTRSCT
jgi:hypothetical protein